MSALSQKKIVLGICGSIAAYKSLLILRQLVKSGAEVEVIMTEAAADFVGPLSYSTLSGKPVLTHIHSESDWNNHVHLGLWADLLIVAPATAQTIAKFANGMVDNLLTAVFLSARCPVMIAPAMDVDMWYHAATQRNIKFLESIGVRIIPVEEGLLASGLSGAGRLAEPENILNLVHSFFQVQQSMNGRKVLITAGPTQEPIDPVRFISNYSSGKMGVRIAEICLERGAEVHLILGPSNENIPVHKHLNLMRVKTAEEMFDAVKSMYMDMTDFILAAAVADYRPLDSSAQKIKKTDELLQLTLTKTPDIAMFVGAHKSPNQKLVGFALETNDFLANARAKLHKKNMDMIVLNSTGEQGVGFGYDTNRIEILDQKGGHVIFDKKSKKEVAADIVNALLLL
ncbi:MAG: bifunctional phosphopantothenoylcysteine decarboxylase/phosphopantothenate--cysteine ligase CoaBC [Saprospiraceae bacterium]|nr:bifunctional phosphopantothenoylcysteine decarboxylase/phosphopantothenate--cysteine ligase CoaBC [Saprospiraceae bacterium]